MNKPFHILLGMASAVAAAPVAAQSLDLKLTPIRADSGEVGGIAVEQRLDNPGAASEPLTLDAPIVYAAIEVAHRISGLTVADADGIVELASRDDPAAPGGFPFFRHWTTSRPVSYPVTIKYFTAVESPDAGRGPPFGIRAVDGGVTGAGSGFLLLPESVSEGDIRMHWDLSGLTPGSIAVTSFGADEVRMKARFDLLRQAWMMAGPAKHYPDKGKAAFSATWLGQGNFDIHREMKWSSDLYKYLGMSFAYLKPLPDYRVFLRFLSKTGGGTAGPKSFMLSGLAAPLDPKAPGPRATLAHEMIHQWTGQIDEAPGISSWFSEGSTTYYAAILPWKGGYVPFDHYASEINRMTAGYWGSPARGWSADRIAQAGFGDESIRHVPYNRSALYFATLDSRIRARSGGKRTLLDLLTPAFERREKGERFDHESWRALLAAEFGQEAVAEWERVVLKGEMFVPASDAFGPCFRLAPKTYNVEGSEVNGYAYERVATIPGKRCRTW